MIERGQPGQTNSFEPTGDSRLYAERDKAMQTGNESRNDEGRGQEGAKRNSNRGFAAMDPEKQKRIASEGGRAAHRQGVAHEWSRDEAREAGRKGGQMVSRNRDHMSEIGRKGGQSSGQRRQRNASGE